ncbi:MAG: gci 2 [Rubritepida sp.]|nr:gci 2 [Rubritepida sp.]
MSRIRDIRILPLQYAMPPEDAYGMARGLTHVRGAGLVLLDTEDGVEGIGEAWGPASVNAAYLEIVKPYFIGRSVFAQRGIAQTILAKHYHFGTQNGLVAMLSGIDIAAHDAMGKLLNVPVCDLIGGRQRDRVPVYASGGYLTRAEDHLAALAAQLEPLAGRGFGAYKIKIGRHPREDAERAALARRIIGDAPLLTVDVNGNYTLDIVLESMRRMAESDIHWVEEPLAPQDWAGYRELAARTPIPIATGEALYTLFDFRRVIDGRLAAVLQPDLTLCGGLDTARTIGALCGAEHLRVSPHVWGTGIGLAAAVHWVAALPSYPHAENVPYPALIEYDVGRNPLQNGIFETPIRFAEGFLHVPTGPGLGITLDRDALRRFTPA